MLSANSTLCPVLIDSLDSQIGSKHCGCPAAAERVNIADGQIAAIALVHRMSVATRDAGDFKATGVKIVNPWALGSTG